MGTLKLWRRLGAAFRRLERSTRPIVVRAEVASFTHCSLLLSIALRPGTTAHPSEADLARAFVAEFRFFDEKGARLRGCFESFEHSKKWENFLSIPGSVEERSVSLAFRTPARTKCVSVRITPWRLSVLDVVGSPQVVVSPEEILRKEIAHHEQRGDLSRALKAAERRYRLTSWRVDARKCRQIRGSLRDADQNWQPDVSSRREVVARYENGKTLRIAHFIKSCQPYDTGEYTERVHQTLTGQLALGLTPLGITPIGYPIKETPTEQSSAGAEKVTVYRHISFPHSAAWCDLPEDEKLRYDTFFSCIVLREFKPHLMHAHSGDRGYELALKGLALRKLFGVPLIYEVSGAYEESWTTLPRPHAELTKLRKAQDKRCMQEADAVVAVSKSLHAELVQRGVDRHKIRIIPNPADAEAYRDLYRELVAARP